MKELCDRLGLETPQGMWWSLRIEYRAWFAAILYIPIFVFWACAFAWRFGVRAPE